MVDVDAISGQAERREAVALSGEVLLELTPKQETHLVALYRAGEHTVSELEELFPVTRSTVYRAIQRAGGRAAPTQPKADT